jgi:hypothetical protein
MKKIRACLDLFKEMKKSKYAKFKQVLTLVIKENKMNSRDRVLKAFKRIPGLPDRIPVQFDLCRQLSDHFGKKLGVPVRYTENLYEDVTYRISANELLDDIREIGFEVFNPVFRDIYHRI